MIDARNYTISVQYGNFDGEQCFEARVREFPDIREYADTYNEAYELAVDTIDIVCEQLASKGRTCPHPQESVTEYSGRVTLRLPNSMHRKLAEGAEIEGVSLNQHIVNQLCWADGASRFAKEVHFQAYQIVNRVLRQQYAGGFTSERFSTESLQARYAQKISSARERKH